MAGRVLMLCDDLLFGSKVKATARAHGLEAATFRTQSVLEGKFATDPPTCVIVDIHNPGLDIASLMASVSGLSPRPKVIAFGSHVEIDALRAARQAGCDLVMPRSQFVDLLEGSLVAWSTPGG